LSPQSQAAAEQEAEARARIAAELEAQRLAELALKEKLSQAEQDSQRLVAAAEEKALLALQVL
jgi:hypothetical protein